MSKVTKTAAALFIELVRRGIEAWIEAGEIAARELDADPEWADKLCAENKWITPERVKRFADFGRKKIHPLLYVAGTPGASKLMKMPYSLQEKHVKEPVEVLTPGGEPLLVDVMNLKPNQVDQVFGFDRVRSLAEQRAWIESAQQAAPKPKAQAGLPYRIVNKKVICMEGCTFDHKDIVRLAAETA